MVDMCNELLGEGSDWWGGVSRGSRRSRFALQVTAIKTTL